MAPTTEVSRMERMVNGCGGCVKALLLFVGWCLLLAVCWPIAVAIVILLPFIWLLSLPFRLLSIVIDASFALIKALLFLPARLFGYRHQASSRGNS